MIHSSAVLVEPSGLAVRVTNFVERLAVRRSDAVIGPSRLVVDRLEQLGWVRPEETGSFRCRSSALRRTPIRHRPSTLV